MQTFCEHVDVQVNPVAQVGDQSDVDDGVQDVNCGCSDTDGDASQYADQRIRFVGVADWS